MKNIIQPLKTIVLALVIGLGIGYAMAWTAPTVPPPGANVPAPVNVGATGGKLGSMQYKSDGFAVGGLFQTDFDTYLAVKGGKVGIGTDNPTSALDVRGKISVSTGASVSYTPALWGINLDGGLMNGIDGIGSNVGGTGNSVVFGGSLWIGGWSPSNAGNLYKCDNNGKCQNEGNKTTGRKILAMTSFGDSLWLGDSSGYLYKCDTAGTCSNEGDKGGSITAMVADSANLWIGHDGGSVKKCDTAGSCVKTFAFGNVSTLAVSGNTLFVGIDGSPAKVRACNITTKDCPILSSSVGFGYYITRMINYGDSVVVASAKDPTYQYWDPNEPSSGGDFVSYDAQIFYCTSWACNYDGKASNSYVRSMAIKDNFVYIGSTSSLITGPSTSAAVDIIACSAEDCFFLDDPSEAPLKIPNNGQSGPSAFGLNIFDKTVYTPTKSVTMGDGGLTTRNFSLGGGPTDLMMRRTDAGDYTWKRALVGTPNTLILNYDNDFRGGVKIGGNATIDGSATIHGKLYLPRKKIITCDVQTGKYGFGNNSYGTNVNKASCPGGTALQFWAETGHAEHNDDWNNDQFCKTWVSANGNGIKCNIDSKSIQACSGSGIGVCW